MLEVSICVSFLSPLPSSGLSDLLRVKLTLFPCIVIWSTCQLALMWSSFSQGSENLKWRLFCQHEQWPLTRRISERVNLIPDNPECWVTLGIASCLLWSSEESGPQRGTWQEDLLHGKSIVKIFFLSLWKKKKTYQWTVN